MEAKTIDFFKSVKSDEHVVATSTITCEGGLIIHDFDGSKLVNENFGGDVESSLMLDSKRVDKLISKLKKESNSWFNVFKLLSSKHFRVENREDLLDWLQRNYSHIRAQKDLKMLFKKYGILPAESSWPFG